MNLLLPLLFSLAMSGAPAEPSRDIVVKKTIDPKNRRVCESVYPTGSKLPKKECRTAAEWENLRRESKLGLKQYLQDTEHLRQQSQAGPRTDGPQPGAPR